MAQTLNSRQIPCTKARMFTTPFFLAALVAAEPVKPLAITVVDAATGRGVPLIELKKREMARRLFAVPATVEVYPEPLPLVVEVWPPSTGRLDVNEKLPEYQRRGDLEIWLLHPYERTLTVWRRQADGSYAETVQRGGSVRPVALPGVVIDLDALFRTLDD